jgi:hypothetical protein
MIQNHERNVAANMANARTRGVIKNKYQNYSALPSAQSNANSKWKKTYPLNDRTPPGDQLWWRFAFGPAVR